MSSPQFFNFVVELVKLGGIGLGALVFVLVFLILIKNNRVEGRRANLIEMYMKFGSIFAAFALIVGLIQIFVNRYVDDVSSLTVTYSPSFDEAQLSIPDMKLLASGDPTIVVPDKAVILSGNGTLKITIDGIINQARKLQKTEMKLEDSKALAADLIKLNETVEQNRMPDKRVVEIRSAQREASDSLKINDFAKAHRSIKKVLRSPF